MLLTASDSSQLLQQFDVGVRLDDGGDVRLAACSVQQGVVVEPTAHVGSLHRRQNVLGHVAVEILGVGFQGGEEAEGLAAGLDVLGGKTGEQIEMINQKQFQV